MCSGGLLIVVQLIADELPIEDEKSELCLDLYRFDTILETKAKKGVQQPGCCQRVKRDLFVFDSHSLLKKTWVGFLPHHQGTGRGAWAGRGACVAGRGAGVAGTGKRDKDADNIAILAWLYNNMII
nr:hypothetical protein [Tanacetum cinerariifolium]